MSASADDVIREVDEAGLRLVRFLYCDNGGTVRGKASARHGLEGRIAAGIGLTVAMQAMSGLDHLQDVPVHVIPCIRGRTDGKGVFAQASRWGSIMPAAWSFMLAARSRGLGTVWTTFHLAYEQEAAELLGIPYDEVMQAALIPVAFTKGTDFKPAARKPLGEVVHWERW